MNLVDKHIIFLIGIGGIGMSALARWFNKKGAAVAGYDRTRTPLCEKLENEGINITYEDDINTVPERCRTPDDALLIIITPAIPSENMILSYFNSGDFEVRKRSEILGMITRDHFTIAVAGTHGKTTTSALITHILREANTNITAFLGGITVHEQSNLVINKAPGQGLMKVVVEADEYDRSFLTLNPDIAVITALDPDHLDIYGNLEGMKFSYAQFVKKIKPEGTLVIRKDLIGDLLRDPGKPLKVLEYSLRHHSTRADNIHIEQDMMRFSYVSPETTITNIPFAFPGYHNIENAVAAITVALLLNINTELIKSALSNFRGIKRRFEYIIYSDQVVYIDDYAHHPLEISAFLSSVADMFPGRRITVIFQPHLFSRTRDFAAEFADSLGKAHEVILLDIYPAREKPLPGVTSKLILDRIAHSNKQIIEKNKLVDSLKSKEIDVLLTIGAGDIDQLVGPVKKMLEEKYEISA